MNRLRSLLLHVENAVNAIMQRAAFAALVAMLVVISMQIVFRVFFQALTWSEEVSRFLLVWITFIGASVAYKHGRHIAVTFLVDALPPALGRLVRAATILASMTFFAVVAYTGMKYMGLQSAQLSASLRISMGLVYAVIPLSSAVMFLYAVGDLLELLSPGDKS
jgi:TRAP-type C4-dicarboxylate transport system permease small subunit